MDKLIAEILPLLEAPTAVRSVHLYKLLCGVTFDRSSSSNDLPLSAFLGQETGKTRMEQCEGSFGAEPPAECGVRPTSAAQVWSSAGVRCDLPHTTPYYGEMFHTDVRVLVNKIASSQFGLVYRSNGARHLRNSFRELSDQASIFPNHKVVHSLSVGATRYHDMTDNCFLRSYCSERPNPAGY